MSIPAVIIKIELQLTKGCQQLVPDILSHFVIWANLIHMHMLENKLVLCDKEVQRNKSFASKKASPPFSFYISFQAFQGSSLGKNMLLLRKSCPDESSFDVRKLLFHNVHQSPIANSLMHPVQNRWEIKQTHFHPLTKPQKIKTSKCTSKLLKFHLNQAYRILAT